jgi:phage terminase small subunit
MVKKLRRRQKEFCKNFVQSGNAFEAAVKAGYAETTARCRVKNWLEDPDIINYLEKLRKKEKYSLEAYIQELDKVMELAYKTRNTAILIKVIEAKGKVFGFDKLTISDKEEAGEDSVIEDLFDKIEERADVFRKFGQGKETGDLSDDSS